MTTQLIRSERSLDGRSQNSNRRKLRSITQHLTVAAVFIGVATAGLAGEPPKAYKGSAEFERMRGLVGTWKGKADMGAGSGEMTVTYRLVAGGSAIEERIFEGSPAEMVTMY